MGFFFLFNRDFQYQPGRNGTYSSGKTEDKTIKKRTGGAKTNMPMSSEKFQQDQSQTKSQVIYDYNYLLCYKDQASC